MDTNEEYLTSPAPATNADGHTVSFYDWGTNVNPRDRYRCVMEDAAGGIGLADASSKHLAQEQAREDYTQDS